MACSAVILAPYIREWDTTHQNVLFNVRQPLHSSIFYIWLVFKRCGSILCLMSLRALSIMATNRAPKQWTLYLKPKQSLHLRAGDKMYYLYILALDAQPFHGRTRTRPNRGFADDNDDIPVMTCNQPSHSKPKSHNPGLNARSSGQLLPYCASQYNSKQAFREFLVSPALIRNYKAVISISFIWLQYLNQNCMRKLFRCLSSVCAARPYIW